MTNALVPVDASSLAPADVSASGDILTSPHALRHALEMAGVLARSQLVPPTFRGKPEDVFAAILLARSLGENVLTVLQNVHFVSGKPGFAAPFLIALAGKSGIFDDGGLRFETTGAGADIAVTCWAIVRASGERVQRTVSLAMAKADGWTKNAKYNSLPEQMLSYRAATFLIRLYAPGVLLGYRPTDELEDIAAGRATYTDPEPALSPPHRAATTAPASSLSPGPDAPTQLVSAGASGPGDSPYPPHAELLARVTALRAQHESIVKREAKMMGLGSPAKSSVAELIALIDAVTDQVERDAIAAEGTPLEGATP